MTICIWSPRYWSILMCTLCLIGSFPRTNWTTLVVEDHWEQRPRGLRLAWFVAASVIQPLVACWPRLGSLNPTNRGRGTSHAQRSPCSGDLSTLCWCPIFACKVGVRFNTEMVEVGSTFVPIVSLKERLNLINRFRSLVWRIWTLHSIISWAALGHKKSVWFDDLIVAVAIFSTFLLWL